MDSTRDEHHRLVVYVKTARARAEEESQRRACLGAGDRRRCSR